MSKKTRAELEAELRTLRRAKRAEGLVSLGNNAVRWGALVLMAYYASVSVQALAGKETLTSLELNLLNKIEISVTLAWVAAFFGIAYGAVQRKLRKDTVERLQGRITELEGIIDPRRSSSQLTPRGDTRPEDRSS